MHIRMYILYIIYVYICNFYKTTILHIFVRGTACHTFLSQNLIGKLSTVLSCPQEFALLLYHYTVRCSELYAICVLSITTVIVVPSWVWCPDN